MVFGILLARDQAGCLASGVGLTNHQLVTK